MIKKVLPKTGKRLYFLDALRAFAILMMLQGHFISGLLDKNTVDTSGSLYQIWLYCRGFTAPIFFTITGWVFTYLLLKNPVQGLKNPRIKKGLKRGLELLFWGYLLRLNLPTLFKGEINGAFIQPDVLHIIGLSLGFILAFYLITQTLKHWAGPLFLILGIVIFLLQPLYSGVVIDSIPPFLAGYLVKGNGGVFYLLPWLGYVSIGTAIAFFMKRFYENVLETGLLFIVLGLLLVYRSSAFFLMLDGLLPGDLLFRVANNNFLFIRLGDVFVFMGIFMFLESILKHQAWLFVGTHTLELYIVHYFILYGSLSGIGLYKYFNHSLTFEQASVGAIGFMLICVLLVVFYEFISKTFTPFLLSKKSS